MLLLLVERVRKGKMSAKGKRHLIPLTESEFIPEITNHLFLEERHFFK